MVVWIVIYLIVSLNNGNVISGIHASCTSYWDENLSPLIEKRCKWWCEFALFYLFWNHDGVIIQSFCKQVGEKGSKRMTFKDIRFWWLHKSTSEREISLSLWFGGVLQLGNLVLKPIHSYKSKGKRLLSFFTMPFSNGKYSFHLFLVAGKPCCMASQTFIPFSTRLLLRFV